MYRVNTQRLGRWLVRRPPSGAWPRHDRTGCTRATTAIDASLAHEAGVRTDDKSGWSIMLFWLAIYTAASPLFVGFCLHPTIYSYILFISLLLGWVYSCPCATIIYLFMKNLYSLVPNFDWPLYRNLLKNGQWQGVDYVAVCHTTTTTACDIHARTHTHNHTQMYKWHPPCLYCPGVVIS